MAVTHNLVLSTGRTSNIKTGGEKRLVFLHLLHIRDLLDSTLYFCYSPAVILFKAYIVPAWTPSCQIANCMTASIVAIS